MILEAKGVSFTYPRGGAVFSELDVSLAKGEMVSLEGPSGSGKTTLLTVLAGLVRPTAGTVTLAGSRLDTLDDRGRARARRAHVGFVFQGYHLLSALTARQNVVEPMVLAGRPRREAEARADATLERLGLRALASQRPAELSGGEKQRVAVARAIAPSPDVVFADEPTAALDFRTGQVVVGLLRDFATAGGTVLLVTHDTRLRPFVDRLLTMEDGRLSAPDLSHEGRT